MADCKDIINEYTDWLNRDFSISNENGKCNIVTSFLLPNNDCIELDVYNKDDGLIVSDKGETVDYLFLNGIDMNHTRSNHIKAVMQRTGLKFNEDVIYGVAKNIQELPLVINSVISAVKDVSCLIYTASGREVSYFKEKIETFLDLHKIKYNTGYSIMGYSIKHNFDLAIIKNRINLIEPLSVFNSSRAISLAETVSFRFNDVKRVNDNVVSISCIDDSLDVWSPKPMNVLEKYSDHVISWNKDHDKIIDIINAA